MTNDGNTQWERPVKRGSGLDQLCGKTCGIVCGARDRGERSFYPTFFTPPCLHYIIFVYVPALL